MELELSHIFPIPIETLWTFILDPQRVSKCVPGMQSVDVISDTEYNASIKVKIAFISAQFSIRTVITEMKAPHHLQAEANGQDKSIGSAVKALVDMKLTTIDANQTELRITSKATIFGRLGTLGLTPMRTKAERMWEAFCTALTAMFLEGEQPDISAAPLRAATSGETSQNTASITQPAAFMTSVTPSAPLPRPKGKGIFSRFRKGGAAETIHIRLERDGTKITICCPVSCIDQCLAWLDQQLLIQTKG